MTWSTVINLSMIGQRGSPAGLSPCLSGRVVASVQLPHSQASHGQPHANAGDWPPLDAAVAAAKQPEYYWARCWCTVRTGVLRSAVFCAAPAPSAPRQCWWSASLPPLQPPQPEGTCRPRTQQPRSRRPRPKILALLGASSSTLSPLTSPTQPMECRTALKYAPFCLENLWEMQ